MALEDGRDIIRGLQGLVLQALDAVCLEVDGRCHLGPADAVQVVLAAQVPHQLRQPDERLCVPGVLDADDVRDARSHRWGARAAAASAPTWRRGSTAWRGCSTALGATWASKSSSSKRSHSFAG